MSSATREYVPQFEGGPYSTLLALYKAASCHTTPSNIRHPTLTSSSSPQIPPSGILTDNQLLDRLSGLPNAVKSLRMWLTGLQERGLVRKIETSGGYGGGENAGLVTSAHKWALTASGRYLVRTKLVPTAGQKRRRRAEIATSHTVLAREVNGARGVHAVDMHSTSEGIFTTSDGVGQLPAGFFSLLSDYLFFFFSFFRQF
jgi:hypothetical protein